MYFDCRFRPKIFKQFSELCNKTFLFLLDSFSSNINLHLSFHSTQMHTQSQNFHDIFCSNNGLYLILFMFLFTFVNYVFLFLCILIVKYVLFCVFCFIVFFMYCFCVNVYCTTATGCQPNCCQQIYLIILYHIITYHIISYTIPYHIILPMPHSIFFHAKFAAEQIYSFGSYIWQDKAENVRLLNIEKLTEIHVLLYHPAQGAFKQMMAFVKCYISLIAGLPR